MLESPGSQWREATDRAPGTTRDTTERGKMTERRRSEARYLLLEVLQVD